ncbi:UNVERIFIED_CONTAM: hypothetical protein HDU68_004303 [Siphonaria sp. JEL0065]|nr:hypothetical protein HDU68_004303 [Siphonaria sp. JEL0065]
MPYNDIIVTTSKHANHIFLKTFFDCKSDEPKSTLQSYPNYLTLQLDSSANSILIHLETKDDEGERRGALESALDEKALEVRADSRFCHDFIEDEECDIEEVVVTSSLFGCLLGQIKNQNDATLKEMGLED